MEENKSCAAALSPQTHTRAETTCDTHRIKHKHTNWLKKKNKNETPMQKIDWKWAIPSVQQAHTHTLCTIARTKRLIVLTHTSHTSRVCAPVPAMVTPSKPEVKPTTLMQETHLKNKISLRAGEGRRGFACAATLAWCKPPACWRQQQRRRSPCSYSAREIGWSSTRRDGADSAAIVQPAWFSTGGAWKTRRAAREKQGQQLLQSI